MKLFHTPTSPLVRKVMVVALETGQEIETLPAAPSPVRRDRTIAAANPSAMVPTAILPDGGALYDSRVITRWLDSRHEGAKMYPEGEALWTVLRREALADGMIGAAVLMRYETTIRPEALRWPDWLDGQREKVTGSLDQLEAEAAGFAGVDAGLIAIACGLGFLDLRFADLDWRPTRPALAHWFAAFSARPSMEATRPG
ncbi:MAG: glutathione S-transferase family protein [Rhodobacteraceae bacterium]|nr:glutathione S-transferase family protein [Paracoccaceae bacterium]